MEKNIIKIAVGLPHAYPWKRENFNIDNGQLKEILNKYNLETMPKRMVAGWKINSNIFKKVLTSNTPDEIVEFTTNNLAKEKYVSEELVRDIIGRKRLNNEVEIEVFKNFIKNKLTIEEKKKNSRNIIIWLVELVTFYMATKDSSVKAVDIAKEVERILNNKFKEIAHNKGKIEEIQKKQGLKRDDSIILIAKNFKDSNDIYLELLSKFINDEKEKNEEKEETLEDSLFDILNEGEDSDSVESDEGRIVEDKIEQINNPKEESNKCENENEDIEKNNIDDIEVNLKALARSLGYEVVSRDKYISEDEDKEIEILKELASLNKGCVLSELYNAYTNINDISKENLEAIMSNFFTALKIQGFEIDDEKLVGDKITVNTNDVLKEFVFSHSIASEGEVEVIVEYLSWNYKGKKVTPMVVKPNK